MDTGEPLRIAPRAAYSFGLTGGRAGLRSLLIDPSRDDPLICAASANSPRVR